MAYVKKKKKHHIETPAERAWIDEKLNASKKWHKPYKGETRFKRKGSSQECIHTAGYSTYDELNADAEKIINEMNSLDKGHTWELISAKIIGQSIDDERS